MHYDINTWLGIYCFLIRDWFALAWKRPVYCKPLVWLQDTKNAIKLLSVEESIRMCPLVFLPWWLTINFRSDWYPVSYLANPATRYHYLPTIWWLFVPCDKVHCLAGRYLYQPHTWSASICHSGCLYRLRNLLSASFPWNVRHHDHGRWSSPTPWRKEDASGFSMGLNCKKELS